MKKPQIGNLTLKGWAVLAPMAGICDLPYRVIVMEHGAAMTTTEMVSAKGLYYKNEKTEHMLKISDREHPVSIQLFGSAPDIMALGAREVEKAGADAVDINMGCPMQKIVRNGEGSALMKNVSLAADIVSAMVKAVSIPVTVKMRIGWDEGSINCVELAKAVEEAGAAAITVHGRTRKEMYMGHAHWDVIRQVVDAVSIPVFGNGDVVDGPSAKRLMDETGCAGVAVGRAAWGNPWVFESINAYLENGTILPDPTPEERLDMAELHLKGLAAWKGEYVAVREMRAHASHYFHGLRKATELRRGIMKAQTEKEFIQLLHAYKEQFRCV